jgi:hypothetical protein
LREVTYSSVSPYRDLRCALRTKMREITMERLARVRAL